MDEPARILVVDDEVPLAGMVAAYLDRAGFRVRQAHTGPDGLDVAKAWNPDVVILDIGLPGVDGLEVCRRLRARSDAYVLMLTARDDEVDRIVGLSVGADDYVTKPFSPREIVARVQAMLRRPRTHSLRVPTAEIRRFADLRIDVTAREVHLGPARVELTPTEFELLQVLSAHPRMAFSREQLIDQVWGADHYGEARVVDVHIGNLRKKLGDDPDHPRFVVTVRGHGYRMGPR